MVAAARVGYCVGAEVRAGLVCLEFNGKAYAVRFRLCCLCVAEQYGLDCGLDCAAAWFGVLFALDFFGSWFGLLS